MGEKRRKMKHDLDAPPASVRTSTDVDRVRACIRQGGRLTVRMIADELNIIECTVQQIVTQDVNMKKKCVQKLFKKNFE
jgi:hypothetical protein